MYRQCNCNYNNNPYQFNDLIDDLIENNQFNPIYSNMNNYYPDNDSCGFDDDYGVFPEYPMFGQSYVPIQIMNNTFTPANGLKMGTIFPELVSPYYPGLSIEQINYIKESGTSWKNQM